MRNKIEKKNEVIYLNNTNFVEEILKNCEIQNSRIINQTRWLTFNPDYIENRIGKEIEIIIKHIFNLRKLQKDEEAIDISDAFFQSFTPLMNILIEQNNYHQVSFMWIWLIQKIKKIENSKGIEFGHGVHKGTAFYFLGFSKLMMGDIDSAYLSFAEAAKEDEIFPKTVLDRHLKGLPPVVKILLLDLSPDNFAYKYVKDIHDTIMNWEHTYTDISRKTSIFKSVQQAIDKNIMPKESAIHLNYGFTKAYVQIKWKKDITRSTFLKITQLGDNILRFARTLEDFIRFSQKLNKDIKLFNYCHNEWFKSENWNVPNYVNDIDALITDFLNDKWKLSKDGRNLLFTLKIRNALAHRIPNIKKLYENYVEIILAISSSFGFVCDELSK